MQALSALIFQAEDGIRDPLWSRGLGDVYKRQELRKSEKVDFDFETKTWTIPPENHKLGKSRGKPLLRPIIPATEDYLRQAFALSGESPYVFTNDGSNEMMGTSAPLQIPYNIMQYLRRHEDYEIPHFSLHDLRRTCRSNLSTLTDFHVAERMLGHTFGLSLIHI